MGGEDVATTTQGAPAVDGERDRVREEVRARYAEAAVASSCCGPSCCEGGSAPVDVRFGAARYAAADRRSLPVEAVTASLGCGDPITVAGLRAGERVLDLGSGGGIDVLLSARRVGPAGVVHGVDMTEEMVDLARANAARAGVDNVEFHLGTIEDLPLPDACVDVVLSNCVLNLSTDKPAALAETFRVLAPGGRVAVSDVVAEDHLTPEERAERGSFVGCIAGALSRAEYVAGLTAAGFTDVSVEFTHEVAPGMHGAVVRARKPAA
jgi:SAM-dependent methyltransferase